MPNAILPFGSDFAYGDVKVASTPTYTTFTLLNQIEMPLGYSVDKEETTYHGGNTDRIRTFLPTLVTANTFNVELLFNWNEATHIWVVNQANSFVERAWRITLPFDPESGNSTTQQQYEFDGWVENVGNFQNTVENLLVLPFTVHRNSALTITVEA